MKTYKHLFEKICSFENLLQAARKAQRGKRLKASTAVFNINLEHELCELRRQLSNQAYIPGQYTEFFIYDPKKRMISAAPYRDRVVHHALINVIGPIFENTFIYDSYSNREGKGTHKAILRFQEFCRKNRYVYKCDIQKYFPSIDHEILKAEIRDKIACPETLWLIDTIIDNSNAQEEILLYFKNDNLFTPIERRRGLPIGNLTSQYFANVYLNRFDHFVKEVLQMKYFLRYVDDFAILENEKQPLHEAGQAIADFLDQYRVRMHPKKSRIYRTSEGVVFLGHRVFPEYRLLKKENAYRFRRKLARMQQDYSEGKIGLEEIGRSIRAWVAHASFSKTYGLRRKLFSEFILKRSAK